MTSPQAQPLGLASILANWLPAFSLEERRQAIREYAEVALGFAVVDRDQFASLQAVQRQALRSMSATGVDPMARAFYTIRAHDNETGTAKGADLHDAWLRIQPVALALASGLHISHQHRWIARSRSGSVMDRAAQLAALATWKKEAAAGGPPHARYLLGHHSSSTEVGDPVSRTLVVDWLNQFELTGAGAMADDLYSRPYSTLTVHILLVEAQLRCQLVEHDLALLDVGIMNFDNDGEEDGGVVAEAPGTIINTFPLAYPIETSSVSAWREHLRSSLQARPEGAVQPSVVMGCIAIPVTDADDDATSSRDNGADKHAAWWTVYQLDVAARRASLYAWDEEQRIAEMTYQALIKIVAALCRELGQDRSNRSSPTKWDYSCVHPTRLSEAAKASRHSGPVAIRTIDVIAVSGGATGLSTQLLKEMLAEYQDDEAALIRLRERQIANLLDQRSAAAELYNDIQQGGRTVDRVLARVTAARR